MSQREFYDPNPFNVELPPGLGQLVLYLDGKTLTEGEVVTKVLDSFDEKCIIEFDSNGTLTLHTRRWWNNRVWKLIRSRIYEEPKVCCIHPTTIEPIDGSLNDDMVVGSPVVNVVEEVVAVIEELVSTNFTQSSDEDEPTSEMETNESQVMQPEDICPAGETIKVDEPTSNLPEPTVDIPHETTVSSSGWSDTSSHSSGSSWSDDSSSSGGDYSGGSSDYSGGGSDFGGGCDSDGCAGGD